MYHVKQHWANFIRGIRAFFAACKPLPMEKQLEPFGDSFPYIMGVDKNWEEHHKRQTELRLNVPQLEPPTHEQLCFACSQIVGTPFWRTIKIHLLSEVEMFRSEIAFNMNPEAPGFREKFNNAQVEIRARENSVLLIEGWAREAQETQEDEDNGEDE